MAIPGLNLHYHGHLIFDKSAMSIQVASLAKNMEQLGIHKEKKMKLDFGFTSYREINSKWTSVLSLRAKYHKTLRRIKLEWIFMTFDGAKNS